MKKLLLVGLLPLMASCTIEDDYAMNDYRYQPRPRVYTKHHHYHQYEAPPEVRRHYHQTDRKTIIVKDPSFVPNRGQKNVHRHEDGQQGQAGAVLEAPSSVSPSNRHSHG